MKKIVLESIMILSFLVLYALTGSYEQENIGTIGYMILSLMDIAVFTAAGRKLKYINF